MTILANARHEAFARAIVKGKSAAAAYVAAGYKADDGNAIRLTGNDRVAARIAELKEQAAQGAVMAARETLERISARARDETKGHEALQLKALELMGKHHELFTDKHKHNVSPIEGQITIEFVHPPRRKDDKPKGLHPTAPIRAISPPGR